MDNLVRRSIGRVAVAASLGAAPVVVTLLAITVAPAGAVVAGPCDASGAVDATAYAPRRIRGNQVVTIPKTGTVRWQGSIVGGARPSARAAAARVAYRGGVELTVAGFELSVDRWHGTTGKMATEGALAYDAGVLPGGVVYRLHATHSRGRVKCAGEMLVKLEGGKGVAVPIACAGTAAAFLLALLSAVRARWALGALAGLALGAFVALDLVLFARADLASRVLLVFPIAGLVLGAIVPMARRSRPNRLAA